jgi:hypothetical protein
MGRSNDIMLWDARELELIEREAQKNKMSVSDYVRSCVFFDLILSGNVRALQIMSARIKFYIRNKLRVQYETLLGDKNV